MRIHNAFDPDKAVCYLRDPYTDQFFAWARQKEAVQIAKGRLELALQDYDLETPFVIRPARSICLQSSEHVKYKKELTRAILFQFDRGSHALVESMCFGSEMGRASAGTAS
jgi:hypothetical protein